MHIYRVTYQIDIDTDTPSPHQAVVNALRHLQTKGATLEVEDPDTDTITEVNVAPLYANDLHLRDHTLPKGERCWITCGPASISINSTDEGVIVDVWPAGQEEPGESVASLGVMYDELED